MSLSLEDRSAIAEVLSKAAYGYDAKQLDMLEQCLHPDAQFSIRIQDGDLIGPFVGREAIMELYRQSMETQTDQRRHVVSNVFFADDGANPEVLSNLTLIATENGDTRVLSVGVYRDKFSRSEGRWQILRRHLDLDNSY